MHAHTRTHRRPHVDLPTYTFTWTCVHTRVHIHTRTPSPRIFTCIHVSTYTHIHARTHIHIHTYTYRHIHSRVHTHTSIYTHGTHTHVYTHPHVYTPARTRVHRYIIHTHTHVHTFTHIPRKDPTTPCRSNVPGRGLRVVKNSVKTHISTDSSNTKTYSVKKGRSTNNHRRGTKGRLVAGTRLRTGPVGLPETFLTPRTTAHPATHLPTSRPSLPHPW